QNWGHRAKSHSLPLLIRLARLSRTKPGGRACIRRLRRPYAVQKKTIESAGSQPAKADSALPSHLLRIMETPRLSNAPASAEGVILRSCALFSWHERDLGMCFAPGLTAPRQRRPCSAHHRSLSPPELRLLFPERPDKDVAANRRRGSRGGMKRPAFDSRAERACALRGDWPCGSSPLPAAARVCAPERTNGKHRRRPGAGLGCLRTGSSRQPWASVHSFFRRGSPGHDHFLRCSFIS